VNTTPNGRPTPRERWRRARYAPVDALLTAGYRLTGRHPAVWRFLVRRYHPALAGLAARHARITCALAAIGVPAYRDFVRRAGTAGCRELAGSTPTGSRGRSTGSAAWSAVRA
jgi:hypothetical protein